MQTTSCDLRPITHRPSPIACNLSPSTTDRQCVSGVIESWPSPNAELYQNMTP